MGVLVGLIALRRRVAGLGLGIGKVGVFGLDRFLETGLRIGLPRAFGERRFRCRGGRDLRAGVAADQSGELPFEIGGEFLIARP